MLIFGFLTLLMIPTIIVFIILLVKLIMESNHLYDLKNEGKHPPMKPLYVLLGATLLVGFIGVKIFIAMVKIAMILNP